MSDTPDFLSEEQSSAPEPEAETPAAPEAAPQEDRPADAPQPEAEPEAQPEEPQEPKAHHVPLAPFLEMRDENKDLKRKLKEFEDRERQRQEQAIRRQPPDRNADPEGYEDFRSQELQEQMRRQAFAFSRKMAVRDHGQDAVDAAFQWGVDRCDSDPLFNQRVAQADDPFEFVVTEWKRDKLVSQVSDEDFAAFQQWRAQQAGQPPAPAKPAAPAVSPRAPTPSLAGAPSASRSAAPEPKDGASTFEGMFGS